MDDEIKKEKELDTRKMIIKLALLVVMLILLITGTSLAAYTWVHTGSNPNTISAVDISMDLLESSNEVISITNALPMEDEDGIYQNDSFKFAVSTTTTANTTIGYTITIEKLTADTGYTLLNDSDIKVYLEDYEGNELVEPTLISDLTNYVLYTSSHSHSLSNEVVQDKFKLRAWIDESLMSAAANWTTNTKLQYKFKIKVSGAEI